jgi:hypothetical protein
MKNLLVIYSCKKYSFMIPYYLEKYANMGFDTYYLYGEPDLEDDCVVDKETRIIKVKCEDNFESLPKKTYYMLKVFLGCEEFSDYEHLIKMDDDTELNINYDQLEASDLFNKKMDYMGHKLVKSGQMPHNYHFGKCSDNLLNLKPFELDENVSWGIGYFYILTRKAADIICNVIDDSQDILNENFYEDMMVGRILINNDIEFTEVLQHYIVTELPRPRRTSINILLGTTSQHSNSTSTMAKVSHIPSISKIRRVTFSVNRGNNNEVTYDVDINDKIKKEVNMNRELDNRIKELSNKIEVNTKGYVNQRQTNQNMRPPIRNAPEIHKPQTRLLSEVKQNFKQTSDNKSTIKDNIDPIKPGSKVESIRDGRLGYNPLALKNASKIGKTNKVQIRR